MEFSIKIGWVAEISETGFRVSRPRPRLASTQSQFRDRDRDFFLVVSTTRLRPRLFSQSLNFEIEPETFFCQISRSRLRPRLPLVSKLRPRPRFFRDSCTPLESFILRAQQ